MEQTIIADALDNLRVHQRQLDMDGTEVGVSRQALNEAISYIGRLTADRDFWKERLQVETRARIEAEALSRTGAVKVDECKHVDWGQYPDGTRVCSYCGLASHPDDAAVERFAAAMKAKLAKKRSEGRGGWQNKEQCSGEYLSRLLREHVEKGDPIDVGNLAMMLHQRSERISALEPAAPEGQQEAVAWQHIPNCGVDRESKMVHVTGKVFCDPCIAPLVAALNAASIETVASCCGHGHRPGVIVLRDGRELFIAKDFEEARKVDAAFPTDINGDARPTERAVTEAARAVCDNAKLVDIGKNGAFNYVVSPYLIDALKAALEAGRHD